MAPTGACQKHAMRNVQYGVLWSTSSARATGLPMGQFKASPRSGARLTQHPGLVRDCIRLNTSGWPNRYGFVMERTNHTHYMSGISRDRVYLVKGSLGRVYLGCSKSYFVDIREMRLCGTCRRPDRGFSLNHLGAFTSLGPPGAFVAVAFTSDIET